MLDTINTRIALLYDREHTVGHSYFLPLINTPTLQCLAQIFSRHILPLLEEYFFEDWEKIRQVLGDDQKNDQSTCFIVPTNSDSDVQALLSSDLEPSLVGRAYKRNDVALLKPEAYRLIYARDEA